MIVTTPSVAARGLACLAGLAALGVGVSGCGSSGGAAEASAAQGAQKTSVTVTAADNKCEVSTAALASGRHTFAVKNEGSNVTEVYVYAAGDRIVGEVENVGPAISRNLVVDLDPGSYQVTCKPGMSGQGVRSALTVTGAAVSAAPLAAELATAVTSYRGYVEAQTAALLVTTEPFVAAVKAGDAAKAKALYPAARLRYERIEPIAESFGDLDPLIDMREDDVSDGTPFVGFHRLERDLFKTGDISASGAIADALLDDVKKLAALIPSVKITPLTMANGAKSLLDEVAKSKVTGEEERYSRVDLVDFVGNVDGAKTAYSYLRPALATNDRTLVSKLDARFDALIALLDSHSAAPGDAGYVAGSGYVGYDDLTAAQIKALATEVDAISEPLGSVPAALG